MKEVLFLYSVAGLYFMLAISPGPNFLVTMTAANESRRQAIYTGLGVSSASVFWASLAVAGLGVVFAHAEWAQRMLQIGGGLYLIYAGIKLFRQADRPMVRADAGVAPRTASQAYRYGLATNLANPKSLVFFGSVFATLFSPELKTWTKLAAIAVVALISLGWNLVVATVFSHPRSQLGYHHAKPWIDRFTGGLLGFFGLKLIFSR